jgi:hypothetical protein
MVILTMTDYLIQAKTAATSAIEKIQPLIDIKNSWQADEEDIQTKACEVSLAFDSATVELRSAMKLIVGLLEDPPAYGDDRQIHQIQRIRSLELQEFSRRAIKCCDSGIRLLAELDEFAMEVEDQDGERMGLAEAKLRADNVQHDAECMHADATMVVERCGRVEGGGH